MGSTPVFSGLYLVVNDMRASVAFYRELGVEIPAGAEDEIHVSVQLVDGVTLALGTTQLTRSYNPTWELAAGGTTNALQLNVASREEVDDVYERLTAAGHPGPLAPFDAFWGSRYAEVTDPDGNVVGFHSPRDPAMAGRPPL